tara:strand:+ start:1 stop:1152 length:1152 start_codon:yes stop_codon:yes gene_type:complete
MKFNKKKFSHYIIFIFTGINYCIGLVLSIFFRKENNNILLFGQKLIGNLEVIFKDKRLSNNNIYYITLNYGEYRNLKKIYGRKILTPFNIFNIVKGFNSKVIITSHGIFLHNFVNKIGIKTILCGHAINGAIPKNNKKIVKYFQLFHEVWLHSPYDKKILCEELFCNSNNLKVLGFVRNQVLIENIKEKNKLKYENSMSDKKIILYAPTSHRGNNDYIDSEFSPFNIKFYEFMNKLLTNTNIYLIIKPHYKDTLSSQIHEYIKLNDHMFLNEELNLQNDYDVMIMSDLLITDISTVYVDYLLIGNPIYLINNPDPDPDMKRSSILRNIDLPKIKNKKDIQDLITKLSDGEIVDDNIKILKDKIFENINHSMIIDKINKILAEN